MHDGTTIKNTKLSVYNEISNNTNIKTYVYVVYLEGSFAVVASEA